MDDHPFADDGESIAEESVYELESDGTDSAFESNPGQSRTRKEPVVLGIPPQMERPVAEEDPVTSPVNPSEPLTPIMRRDDLDNFPLKPPKTSVYSIPTTNEYHTIPYGLYNNSQEDNKSPETVTRVSDSQWILRKPVRQDAEWPTKPETKRVIENEQDLSNAQDLNEKTKKEWFYKNLSTTLGLIYAMLLVTVGAVIYVWDVLQSHAIVIAEGFNIYLIVVQLLFLFYIHIDCRHYTNLISKKLKEAEKKMDDSNNKHSLEVSEDGVSIIDISQIEMEEIPQHYGFTSGRHGGSLYVKIGAAVFCFCYMIQGGLDLGQKVLYLMEEESGTDPCTSITDITMCVLKLIYVFYKLFFVFKFSNIIINRRLFISNFGLMHCIGSSLCFWIYNILQETFQSLANHTDHSSDVNGSVPEVHSWHNVSVLLQEKDLKMLELNYGCDKETQLTSAINEMTPYLFPFSIEFNILMVGVWILILENMGRIERHTHIPSIEVTYEDDEDNSKSLMSNFLIYVDCHASMRGLFAGLIVTVFTTISVILFYVFSASEDTEDLAWKITAYGELIIFVMMLISSVVVFYHMQKLDIITHSISYADDILLFMCLPLIFLYAIACSIPYIGLDDFITWFYNVMQIIQAIVQTTVICDGLRRCSNSPAMRNKKPGREFIMFLVVTNLAMWLLQTFQIKSKQGNSTAYDYYDKELWTLLSHFTLPFVLFYRFHSSACLADMWMEAFKAEQHDN